MVVSFYVINTFEGYLTDWFLLLKICYNDIDLLLVAPLNQWKILFLIIFLHFFSEKLIFFVYKYDNKKFR